jgi:hypothetical protein
MGVTGLKTCSPFFIARLNLQVYKVFIREKSAYQTGPTDDMQTGMHYSHVRN